MTLAPTPPRLLAARLNAEWFRIIRDASARRRAGRWPVAWAVVGAEPDLEALLAATSRVGGRSVEEADAVLADLVRLAATDDLAARLVLQRLVASLVLVAARRTRSHPAQRQRLFDELTATAWVLIRTFPIDRRPVKVAVNLLRDTEYETCTRAGRLRSADEELVETHAPLWADRASDACGRSLAVDRHPADEVTRVLAAGRAAGVGDDDLDLLEAIVVDGRQVGELARSMHVTARTVYNRRIAVLDRLARADVA